MGRSGGDTFSVSRRFSLAEADASTIVENPGPSPDDWVKQWYFEGDGTDTSFAAMFSGALDGLNADLVGPETYNDLDFEPLEDLFG